MKALLILAALGLSACGKPTVPAISAKAFGSSWYQVNGQTIAVKVLDFTNANTGSVGFIDQSGNVCVEHITLSGDPSTVGNFTIAPTAADSTSCQLSMTANFLMNQTSNQITICTYPAGNPGNQTCANFY